MITEFTSFFFVYSVSSKELGGEERRVGISHHRKTRSRCSIDWSLPSTDLLIENYQEMEIFNRQESNLKTSTPAANDHKANKVLSVESSDPNPRCVNRIIDKNRVQSNNKHPIQKHQSKSDPTHPVVCLPSYNDRINVLKTKRSGRWFPYTYVSFINVPSFFFIVQSTETTSLFFCL